MSREVIAIGECMVELSQVEGGLYRRGFAGDTFNTAWYLRRLLPPDWSVGYGSCVGDDAISDRMLDFMAAAGLATASVRRLRGRSVGLYMIDLAEGERSFSYWRETSAARSLASDEGALAAMLQGKRAVHFSGITLAILPETDRARLIAALGAARQAGTTVVFDPNLRPRLWPDRAVMRRAAADAAESSDIVLPSFDEEAMHFGDASPEVTRDRYRAHGAATVAVKNGPGRVEFWDRDEGEGAVEPEPVPRIVDTTAAGDSFDAAFLASRLRGKPMPEAVRAGARLAAEVIGAYGALVEPKG